MKHFVIGTLADAHNDFGFKMLHELTKQDSGKNVFISPTSISLALTMVYDGAAGNTKNVLAETLVFKNLNQTSIDKDSQLIEQSLSGRQDIELSIANSIWLNKNFQLVAGYPVEMKKYFNAQVSTIDFATPDSANTVNMWVSNKTHDKIRSIVDPPLIDPLILINAIHFKGKWTMEFDKNATHEEKFIAGDDSANPIQMMEQDGEYNYLENSDFQAIELLYKGNFSMFVFLPKKPKFIHKLVHKISSGYSRISIENFANNFDLAKWNKYLSQFEKKKGTIFLPRFKIEYSQNLNQSLINSGMGLAFSNNADFSRMSSAQLKMGAVIHKTFVETNEEGTEAAAVTAIVMVGGPAPSNTEPPFYMKVDHPFFFAIYDRQTRCIVFMGTMNKV